MTAFFSKVFSRKKTDDKGPSSQNNPASVQSLLEGKFEAISPTVSPSADTFPATDKGPTQDKDKDKERKEERERGGLGLFHPLARQKSPAPSAAKRIDDIPHLTLNLPGLKGEEKGRALGVVFEAGTDGRVALDSAVLGERRLAPLEALLLIRACSQVISAQGLETLGIMHPHWHSESPTFQRKLLSLFLLSLAPNTPITTLTPTRTATLSEFESELNYSHSPHDIAAVLRWGLRHIKLDGGSFGKEGNVDFAWYDGFAEAERNGSFPPKAFTQYLTPRLPPSHLELLLAVLRTISSLAAHSEMNGISGSKLSMFFGHYLLTGNKMDGVENWQSFYAQWERAGKILEHLFLSHLRDQSVNEKIPQRLVDLVSHYPYSKPSDSADTKFSRPRFSTRRYIALYVHINTMLYPGEVKPTEKHPLNLIQDALKADSKENSELQEVWEGIKRLATGSDVDGGDTDSTPLLSRLFSDETIRLLSLRSTDNASEKQTPTITMFTAAPPVRSPALSFTPNGKANGNSSPAHSSTKLASSSPISPKSDDTHPPSPIASDWNLFSTSGFGEATSQSLAATLLDNEVEKTQPRPISRKSSKRPKTSPSRRSSSADNPASLSASVPHARKSVSTVGPLVDLDEAFVDFWSDALLDPISSSWPTFVLCQLKTSHNVTVGEKKVNCLIIEQTFSTRDSLAESTSPTHSSPTPRPPRSEHGSEKRPNAASRVSSTFSASRKRFNFFSGHHDTVSGVEVKESKRKAAKAPKVGELGEIIHEGSTQPGLTPSLDSNAVQKKDGLDRQSVKNAEVVVGIATVTETAVAASPMQNAEATAGDATLSALPKQSAAEVNSTIPAAEEVSTDKMSIPEATGVTDESHVQDKPPIPSVVAVPHTETSLLSTEVMSPTPATLEKNQIPVDGTLAAVPSSVPDDAPTVTQEVILDPAEAAEGPPVGTVASQATMPEGHVADEPSFQPEPSVVPTTNPPVSVNAAPEGGSISAGATEEAMSQRTENGAISEPSVPEPAKGLQTLSDGSRVTEKAVPSSGVPESRFIEHITTPPNPTIIPKELELQPDSAVTPGGTDETKQVVDSAPPPPEKENESVPEGKEHTSEGQTSLEQAAPELPHEPEASATPVAPLVSVPPSDHEDVPAEADHQPLTDHATVEEPEVKDQGQIDINTPMAANEDLQATQASASAPTSNETTEPTVSSLDSSLVDESPALQKEIPAMTADPQHPTIDEPSQASSLPDQVADPPN